MSFIIDISNILRAKIKKNMDAVNAYSFPILSTGESFFPDNF